MIMKRESSFSQTNQQNQYATLFTSHSIALWEYDCAAEALCFSNDYFHLLGLKQLSISFTDLCGLRSFIHPADLPLFDSAFARVLTDGTVETFRYRLISPCGNTIWLEDHFTSYCADGGTAPQKLLSYTRNVTKEQAEKTQCATELTKYRTLLNAMAPNFVFIFNRDFTFHDVILPDGLKLFDDPNDLLQRSGHSVYSPEVSKLFIKHINESIDTGEQRNIEYHLDLQDNRYYYQARIVPYQGNKAFALIKDISDRVRRVKSLVTARERAEEADRMKTTFLANMSHEIRTPLNAIVGFSELIAADEVDMEEKGKFLEIIQTNNELLLKLINDILDLSRIESGKSEIIYRNAHLFSLIDDVKRVHELKMVPQVAFDAIYPSGDLWIRTDPDRVKQILYNFLSNAIKNTQEGTITLGVEETDDLLRFFVSDTGCGIPDDKVDKIFNRFEKINTFVQGTGLGLSICATLAKRFGGKLEVESVWGEGSTFSFYLPYNKLDKMTLEADEQEMERRMRKRMMILVAENSEENYRIAFNVLQSDYDILQARNGEEAIALYMQKMPDLVLMSIQLPGMDGIESVKVMREVSTEVPIIGLTSNDFYTEQKKAMESGYNDVLSRPYSALKLKETIVALI